MRSPHAASGTLMDGRGILAGVLIGETLGFRVGGIDVTPFVPLAELDALGHLFFGGIIGTRIGGGLGYLGVRSRRRRRRGAPHPQGSGARPSGRSADWLVELWGSGGRRSTRATERNTPPYPRRRKCTFCGYLPLGCQNMAQNTILTRS